MDENIKWLSKWLESQYKNSWQGQQIVAIGTLDNPGWVFDINIDRISQQNLPFSKIKIERSEHDWISCFIEDGWFMGAGGPHNLPEIVQIFRNWIAEGKSRELDSAELQRLANQTGDLFWLTEWFDSQCNGDWEHCYGIDIRNDSGSTWSLEIDIAYTELDNQLFDSFDIKRSEKDWASCLIKPANMGNVLYCYGGLSNLPEMLRIFRNWAEPIWQKDILENS